MKPSYALLTDALPAQRDRVIALWSAHGPLGDRAARKLALAYADTPFGPGDALLLHDGDPGQPVGALGLHPRRYLQGSRSQAAVVLADFAVAAAHRTLGPALMLMRAGIGVGQARAAWVIGVPNAASLAVARRAGLPEATRLVRRGKLLRSAWWLRRQGHEALASALTRPLDGALAVVDRALDRRVRWRWRDAAFDDPALDAIWASRPARLWLGERSAAALAWRFGPASAAPAWRLSIAEAAGQARGYVVWRIAGALVELGDFLCAAPERDLGALLLGFARRCRAQTVAAALSLEFAGPAAIEQRLARAGFLARGEEQPVLLAAGAEAAPGPGEALYLTSFDRDPDV